MLDRDDLGLQDERRQWMNEILSNGGSALRASVIHLGAEHVCIAIDSKR
jgi:hypothetical protein